MYIIVTVCVAAIVLLKL